MVKKGMFIDFLVSSFTQANKKRKIVFVKKTFGLIAKKFNEIFLCIKMISLKSCYTLKKSK